MALWDGYSPVNLESAKWGALHALRALHAHAPYALYMSYMPYVDTCPTIFYRPEN